MAKDSGISWCDHTLNFWVGCTEVGPACDDCYARKWAIRAGRPMLWQGERAKTKTWGDAAKWNRLHNEFFAAHGRRQQVFSNSLSDFFDNEVPEEWRVGAWEVIRANQNLDWLLVTKRVSNIEKMLPVDWALPIGDRPYRHAVFIITVVTQKEADRDIPRLIALKRAYPWLKIGLSMEPLLEYVILRREWLEALDFVIVGGESGGAARPMNVIWAQSLRDQCRDFGVTFHFKQYGEWLTFPPEYPGFIRHEGEVIAARVDGLKYRGTDLHLFEEDQSVAVRVGINRTGRLLDGVLHNDRVKVAA